MNDHIPVDCPSCERVWPAHTEQAICVELYDECQVCKFSGNDPGGVAEMTRIIEVQNERIEWNAKMAIIDEGSIMLTPVDFLEKYKDVLLPVLSRLANK